MLYKQAWQELKDYIKNRLSLLVGQGVIRQRLLEEMNELEKRWRIIPEKKNPGNWGQGAPYKRKKKGANNVTPSSYRSGENSGD